MAVFSHAILLASASFECRSEPHFAVGASNLDPTRSRYCRFAHTAKSVKGTITSNTLSSSQIFKFVRQLNDKEPNMYNNSKKVVHVVMASWSKNSPPSRSKAESDTVIDTDASASVPATSDAAAPEGCIGNESLHIRDGSVAIHAGERFGRCRVEADAITTPVANSSAYFFNKTDDLIHFKQEKCGVRFEYGRYGNPTTVVAEEKISGLEGAESTLVVGSGMCAATMTLLALVPPGGHLVTTTHCYKNTTIFIQTILPKMRIKATTIDPADMNSLKEALEENNVSLFFSESPTNPFMRCIDIKFVSELCHRHGALVCIDGTFASPLNQKVLSLGADLVLHSATKYLGGHNDVLAGCVSGSLKLVSEIRNLHHVIGGVLNPYAAYLIIRGMKTLHLRVQQQNSSALRMAKLLEAHPKIKCVYYTGLPSHPEHNLVKRQMTGFGGVVSFEVDGDFTTTAKFIDSLKIPYIAPSFGGCESIIAQPAIMSYWDVDETERLKYGIKDNLVRFSIGIEDFEDLKADILQALDAI